MIKEDVSTPIIIPLDGGYGWYEEATLGYHYHRNLWRMENGDWITRHDFTALTPPNAASSDPITDMYNVPGQSYMYVIKGGVIYYTGFPLGAWTAVAGLTFTPSYGSWCNANGYTVYCDVGGVPIKFLTSAPTAPILVNGVIWAVNAFTCCLLYKNMLLIAGVNGGGNRIYYSTVGTTTMTGTDYVTVNNDSDSILKMLNVAGTLVVVRKKSIYSRNVNSAALQSNQFDEQIYNSPTAFDSRGICAVDNTIAYIGEQGLVLFTGQPQNKMRGWSKKYYEGEFSFLHYFNSTNHIYAVGASGGSFTGDLKIFDLRQGIWMSWKPAADATAICSNDDNGTLYVGTSDGKIYYTQAQNIVSGAGTADQYLYTSWLTPGGPEGLSYDCYLERVRIYAEGLTTLTVYGRTKPEYALGGPSVKTLLDESGGLTKTNYRANSKIKFHECLVKVTSTGYTRIKGIVLYVKFRRKDTGE